jgi:TfoX/Sxy family transcriptional regulator of competence genes
MASDQAYVGFIMDQLSSVQGISSRKMFGEYAIYINAKVVALICNNTLFVKPTNAGRQYIGSPIEAPPYPGAKPSFEIREQVEDRDWLHRLLTLTYRELPEPKPTSKKKASLNRHGL